ncbi:uncharacterized protein LOC116848553 [Odontomachus brunneus]|uniref:uncharacterized protein LOC116848553 n=1 Tax=Odontomachus brunneus TaxID=486640 RepID=UPI0013F2352A|nr:uncharacterized protein LOC116848553 [Odontomachus brunneus]
MEGRQKKLISFSRPVYISNTELSDASTKEEESISTIDEERFTESCELPRRIELYSSYRGGCSKSCTEHKETVVESARMLDCKPQTLRESSSGQKKLETKPWAKTPLSDQVKTKLKGTSGRLQVLFFFYFSSFSTAAYFRASRGISMSDFRQNALPFFEKATRRTLSKIKSFYAGLKDDLRGRRVLGFKCNLNKCDSTLMECSASSCKKESMIFGGPAYPHDPKDLFDSSASDTSAISSMEKIGRISPS